MFNQELNDIFTVRSNETFDDYKQRIYNAKYNGIITNSWEELSYIFERTFGVKKDESTYRKEAKKLLDMGFLQETINSVINEDDSGTDIQELTEVIREFKKEKYKLAEERTQNNALIRRLSREETIKEIAKDFADKMSAKKILDVNKPKIIRNNQEAIIQLSDWHYGIEISNFLNTFNTEICVQRINELLTHSINYFKQNPVNKIYVVNLGDLICGRIHTTLRLQSRIDTVTQIMQVSEILAEFLTELSKITYIEYYDCLDNHSRLEPVKTDSLELETLARITPWYLKTRLEKNKYIKICANEIDDDIIQFTAMDGKWCIGGVHGHKDKPNRVVDNLTSVTKIKFDLLLTAHYHHFSSDEKNQVMVISNGSLMGTDRYSLDLRLSSVPSQNIIILNDKSPVDTIHRVILD